MTSPLPSITPPPPHNSTGRLGWLLVNFLEEVPGVKAAVLGTLDGLALASAGLGTPQPDHLAAIATTLHSSGKAGGNITDPPGGDVQLVMVQLARKNLFVMNTQQGGGPADTTVAGTLLTVLAARGTDTRMVGKEMARLITSVVSHLSTTTRGAADGGSDGNVESGAGDEG